MPAAPTIAAAPTAKADLNSQLEGEEVVPSLSDLDTSVDVDAFDFEVEVDGRGGEGFEALLPPPTRDDQAPIPNPKAVKALCP